MARGKSIRESWNMNQNRGEIRVRRKVDLRSGSRIKLAKIGICPTQVVIHHCSPHRLQLDGISCAICKPPPEIQDKQVREIQDTGVGEIQGRRILRFEASPHICPSSGGHRRIATA